LTPAARIYGRENSDARIVVHAVADSWVEVRDEKTNELLLTRVLFKGDSYRVPNRPGLIMLTGNAGGLKISVDGQSVPAVGPLGAVRRDIALEPDRLASSAEPAAAAPEAAPSAAPTAAPDSAAEVTPTNPLAPTQSE
jgi:cytoskeleton protein RodZ